MSEPVAIVDWRETSFLPWWAHVPGTGISAPSAVDAMLWCENHHRASLRWECAGAHRFHGYAKDPEPAYESELP